MPRSLRGADAIHLSALGLWLGALTMIGAGAPLVFITLKALDPSLPGFAAYGGPHYLIAGGKVVKRLFGVCDVIQVVAFFTAAATLFWSLRGRALRGAMAKARVAMLLAAGAIVGYRLLVMAPGLNELLSGYWGAAAAGDNELAAVLRGRYESGHRMETRLFGVVAVLVAASIVCSWVQAFRGRSRGAGEVPEP